VSRENDETGSNGNSAFHRSKKRGEISFREPTIRMTVDEVGHRGEKPSGADNKPFWRNLKKPAFSGCETSKRRRKKNLKTTKNQGVGKIEVVFKSWEKKEAVKRGAQRTLGEWKKIFGDKGKTDGNKKFPAV